MSVISGIGDFFRGAFGESDEEKRRRKQREAQEAAARKQQPAPQRPKVQQPTQQATLNSTADVTKPKIVTQTNQLFQTQKPAIAPAPRVTPKSVPPVVATPQVPPASPQPDYKTLGVKDVGDYYGSDLRKLEQEVSKGDKADPQVVAGLQRSLQNRKKELTDYHQSKGKFQTPELTGVPQDETKQFVAYTKQKQQQAAQLKEDQTKHLVLNAGNGNKARFTVAQYADYLTKQPKDMQVMILKGLTQQAEKDPNSAAMIEGLNRNGILNGDLKDFYQGWIDKSGGGLVRGGARVVDTGLNILDKILPGQDQRPVVKAGEYADQLDENYKNTYGAYTKSGKSGESLGTATKAGIDVATLLGGTGAAEKGAESLRYADKIDKAVEGGGKLAKVFGAILKQAPGSLTGTAISSAQTRGKGEKQNLAKDAAIGIAADTLLPYGGGLIKRLFGRGLSGEADDAARTLEKQIEKQPASEVEQIVKGASDDDLARIAEDPLLPAEHKPVIQQEMANRAQAAAENPEHPAFQRGYAKGDEDTVKTLEAGLDPNNPQDKVPAYQRERPTYEAGSNAVTAADRVKELNRQLEVMPSSDNAGSVKFKLQQQLSADIANNPANKDAYIEIYNRNLQKLDDALQQRKVMEDEVAQLSKNVEDATATRAAETAPAPGQVVQDTPVAGSPEVKANDGYSPTTDEIINAGKPTFDEKGRLSIPQLLSPDRVIRENITRPGENLVNRGINALQTSDNRLARGIGRMFTGFNTEAGVDPALQAAKMQMRGGIELGKVNNQSINDLASGFSKEELDNVYATIDKTRAAELGKVVDEASLTPEQAALREKLVAIRDNTSAENLKRGFITPEQAANGEYLQRDYSFLYDKDSEAGKFEQGFRQELLGQYKGRKTVTDEAVQAAITDPAYLVGKKQAQSEAAWAMQDYGNFLAKNGHVIEEARPGYAQLPNTPLFGEAAGKFVPQNIAEDFTGFQYSNAMVSAFNDVITAYDRLGIRQAKKALLTVFNPAVRLGNQVTNRGIFSQLAGINPVQFNMAMAAAKNEIAAGGQLYREAVQHGLTGIDVTQADFFAKRIADSAEGDKGIFKKAIDWTKNSYSGADDQARIAAYMVKRQQGYTAEEAARQVQRGFQDYKSVGFFYDMAAKTPVIGNAFVRFAADSVRIAKNAAIDHPLRTLGTVAAWSAFVNGMSVLSGESEAGKPGDSVPKQAFNLVTGSNKSAAQKDRENRFGAPKIPFTNISMAVQTPIGEVNVARFMPWYSLNDVPGGNPISKVLPIGQSPVEFQDGKMKLNPQAMNDPLLGQLAQLGIDEDFRGKSIRDPQANGDKYAMAPLSTGDQLKNVGRFLFNNNAPVGREIDQTISAATGNPDMYGKDRNIWQALARDAGLKIEEQGAKQAEDRAGLQTYMKDKEQIDNELKDMSPAAQEAWKRLTGYYKLRDQVPNEFVPGETRDKKAEVYDFSEDKWKDFSSHPELYALMVQKKQREYAQDGKPIPPEFDERLTDSFRKQIIQNKIAAPGDDAELDQRMYSTPEWDYYMKLKDEYKKEAEKYYPKSDKENFDDETVKNDDAKFPDKPPLLKAYSAEYKLYQDGKRDKPQWNDALTAQKEAYNKMTLNWTNEARAKRGLPAITWDVWNNPTFGFDETPSSGFGFGFGRGGGGGANSVNTLTRLTNFGDSVKRFAPVEAQAPPNVVQVFQKLMAGKGGRAKPKLGASSSGRG